MNDVITVPLSKTIGAKVFFDNSLPFKLSLGCDLETVQNDFLQSIAFNTGLKPWCE